MNGLINKYSAIMDKYDPQKKVALVVDEWGSWYAPLPGSNPGFLVLQNSMRDAMLAVLNLDIFALLAGPVSGSQIAQMSNVVLAVDRSDEAEEAVPALY